MTEFAVIDPTSGDSLATYPTLSDDELQAAVAKSADAYERWSATSIDDRIRIIGEVSELHAARSRQLADIIGREMGKPVTQALGEVEL